MPEISLTSFVDFVLASGTTRIRRVREIKRQIEEGYSPATDFCKGIRERIVECHREGSDLALLDRVVAQAHERKRLHYQEIAGGYRQFLKGKSVESFDPPWGEWSYGDLRVTINPELGLDVGGVPHVVKLYFKADPVSRRRVQVVLHLMQDALGRSVRKKQVGVLDIRRAKLHSAKALPSDLGALLAGEAAAFIEMWRRV